MAGRLMTFLGRGQKGNYRSATYGFPDGKMEPTKFFGLALLRHLFSQEPRPDLLVMLGTSTSMWDALVELADEGSSSNLWMEVHERVHSADGSPGEGVTDDFLKKIGETFEEYLAKQALSVRVELKLIPSGVDASGQVDILHSLIDGVKNQEHIWLDVTHGFRHLPMMGLLAAFYLELVRDVQVQGVFYGALDMTSGGTTPVVRLDGLLRVAEWVQALAGFDASGNYGLFARLLKQDGLPQYAVDKLSRASFKEMVFAVRDAETDIRAVIAALKGVGADTVSKLFLAPLNERVSWVNQGSLHEKQSGIAQTALEGKQFVRAALVGFEAMISRGLADRNVSESEQVLFKTRDDERIRRIQSQQQDVRRYARELPAEPPVDPSEKLIWEDARFRQLKAIRNALAHGDFREVESVGIKHVFYDENTFRERLRILIGGRQ